LPVDGAPREERTSLADLSRSSAGGIQHPVAVEQKRTRDARGRVGQKRKDVDLGIPEAVPLVPLAGQALGAKSVALDTCRRLDQLKDIEP
jgi:hypothetical protein